jgi:hypothetical protein
MVCFKRQCARLADMRALRPCAQPSSSSLENSTYPASTKTLAEPRYLHRFQKSLKCSYWSALPETVPLSELTILDTMGLIVACRSPEAFTRRYHLNLLVA